MRILLTVISALIISNAAAQNVPEKEITSEISEVTVFIEGAQITRIKDVNLAQGKATLKFSKLSPYIDSKTIQVKVNNSVAVLAVNFQQNYLDKLQKSDELKQLETKLQNIEKKITTSETNLEITSEEIRFLQKNSVITGANQSINLTSFKEISEYYGSKMKSLKMQELDLNKAIEDLRLQANEVRNQIRAITLDKEPTAGEIFISVETPAATSAKFEIRYMVNNAGWFPTYDVRANSIDKPIELLYKANIRQNTKVDWKNVKLKFSSSEPNMSGVAPVLQTYRLGYNIMAPNYNKKQYSVSGHVTSRDDGLPLPGVSVVVAGSTISTITGIDGYYSLTLPTNATQLKYTYIGYEEQTLNINSPIMNVSMVVEAKNLEEICGFAYGVDSRKTMGLRKNSAGANLEVDFIEEDAQDAQVTSKNSEVPMQAANQTSVDFEITKPYTVISDNKTSVVEMIQYSIPTKYQYYSVPKIEKGAYLLANIVNWEKFSLLEGEANIFFEGTFVGKSLLDTRLAGDTLQISLGRDKSISINREIVKSFTDKQIIGTKKSETRNWKTTVKNNKQQAIDILILDQVPVSNAQEIEVTTGKTSGAKLNAQNGEAKWELQLKPSEKKELELNYTVKYPKNKTLVIE